VWSCRTCVADDLLYVDSIRCLLDVYCTIVLVELFPECGVNYAEVRNVLFCCLIMCWRSTAARNLYSALQNAIWADLEKSNMGRGPGKALWIMPKIKCSSMMQYGSSSLDC
jgi:hypothetical protein